MGARKQEKRLTTKYQSASAVNSKIRHHNDDERISSASIRKDFKEEQSNSRQHIGQTWYKGENKQDLEGRELGVIGPPKTRCSVQRGDSRLSLKTFASPPKALVMNGESPRNPSPLFSDSATSARTGNSSFSCTSPELSTETSQPAAGWPLKWSWAWSESDKKEEVCTSEGLIEA